MPNERSRRTLSGRRDPQLKVPARHCKVIADAANCFEQIANVVRDAASQYGVAWNRKVTGRA
jgi:hypothetical protein